jgi:hypothetical protein
MKINLESFRKNKREIYFSVVGSVLAIVLLFVFINAISYLVTGIEKALEVGPSGYNVAKFNVGALKTLGMVQSIPSSVIDE